MHVNSTWMFYLTSAYVALCQVCGAVITCWPTVCAYTLSLLPCPCHDYLLNTMYTFNSSHIQSLFGNKYSANGTVDRSQEQSPLNAYRLRNAFRSASVANEPQVDSAPGTHWKYKPLPLRRKSMASRSPSCCSTASEAESITESLTGKMDFQRSNSYNPDTFRNRNKGSYVYDKSSNFMMGLRRQSLQRLPVQRDMENTSAQLSAKISEFLQRTDHVMEEWKRLGHKEPMDFGSTRIRRSSSVSNIMIKGFRYLGRDSSKSICSTTCDVVSETDEVMSFLSVVESSCVVVVMFVFKHNLNTLTLHMITLCIFVDN